MAGGHGASMFGRKGLTATLGCVLFSMVDQTVCLELKNDSEVTGELVEVDSFMNATMKNVITHTLSGQTIGLDEVYIKGMSIRYVYIAHTE